MNKEEICKIKQWILDFEITKYKSNDEAIDSFNKKRQEVINMRNVTQQSGIVEYTIFYSWTKDLDDVLKTFDSVKKKYYR